MGQIISLGSSFLIAPTGPGKSWQNLCRPASLAASFSYLFMTGVARHDTCVPLSPTRITQFDTGSAWITAGLVQSNGSLLPGLWLPRDHQEHTGPYFLSQLRDFSLALNGLVVSALGIWARWPGFESRVSPLFHWVATLGKLFTHIASPVSQLQETGVQKGVSGA